MIITKKAIFILLTAVLTLTILASEGCDVTTPRVENSNKLMG